MHALSVERRLLNGRPLARSLACSLAERLPCGKVVVVTEKPVATLASVKKQWLRLERKVWLERASTLGVAKICELTERLSSMRRVRFSAKPSDDLLVADVTFATADDLLSVAPECRIMYVTYNFPKEKLHLITSWMPRGGVVIIYG